MSRSNLVKNRVIPFPNPTQEAPEGGTGKEPTCYCCDGPAKPIDFEGSTYYMCDACYAIHVWANKAAVVLLRNDIKRYRRRLEA